MRDLGVETADCYRGCFAADITEEVTRTLCRRRRHEAYFGGGQYWIEDPSRFCRGRSAIACHTAQAGYSR